MPNSNVADSIIPVTNQMEPKLSGKSNMWRIILLILVIILAAGIFMGIYFVTRSQKNTKDPTSQDTASSSDSEFVAKCNGILTHDTNWNLLSSEKLSQLKTGDIVIFSSSAKVNRGKVERARFIINGVTQSEAPARTGTDEFYYEYTIPDGVNKFQVSVQLYHSDKGWF